jgi:hypothetical protein
MDGEMEGNGGEDEGGGFLLESLATLDTVTIQSSEGAASGDTPRAIIRPRVVQVNTAKALREIRENQRKMEKRIAVFTGLIVVSIAVVTALVQTNVLEGGIEGIRQRTGLAGPPQKVNCMLAENRLLDECVSKKSKLNSNWESIERSNGGSVNHFSLNGM